MTDKATESNTEVPAGEAQAQEQAAFDSIVGATGDEPPAPSEPTTPSEPAAAAKPEAPKKADGPLIAGYTEDEVRTLLARAASVPDIEQRFGGEVRRLFGKLGELQSLLGRVQEEAKSRPGRTVDAKQILKRVREVVPDLADPLAEDIAEMFAGSAEQAAAAAQPHAQPQAQPQAQQQPPSIDEVRAQIVEEMNQKFLTKEHPDWREVSKSPEFQGWLGTLPVEQRNNYVYSNDADVAGECFSKFKQWRDSRQKNRSRLEAAVVPSGTPVTPGPGAFTTEEDAFNSVFS